MWNYSQFHASRSIMICLVASALRMPVSQSAICSSLPVDTRLSDFSEGVKLWRRAGRSALEPFFDPEASQLRSPNMPGSSSPVRRHRQEISHDCWAMYGTLD